VGIWLVDAAEMTRLNETFLKHRGCTDVIAFDYSESAGEAPRRPTATARGPHPALHGEVCVCLEAAAAQARRFGTTWQCELARYVTHGLLHLRGFDDRRPADRRRMKREEARLLKGLGSRFELERLGARPDPPKSRARAGAARRNPPRPSARMPQ
jgi:probable rRNA maturation factor